MGIKLSSIKDPNLVRQIENALLNAKILEKEIAIEIPKLAKARKRIRQDTKPLMNKLEERYYNDCLKCLSATVSIQAIRFRLANGLWYKSDFVVWWPRGPEAIEVKGPHAFRGGFENLKMAASTYPFIEWTLVWEALSEWQRQTVLP